MTEECGAVGFWVMSDDSLRDALVAAGKGESVDLILLALYANSDVQTLGDEGG